jgi:hypothetical protein
MSAAGAKGGKKSKRLGAASSLERRPDPLNFCDRDHALWPGTQQGDPATSTFAFLRNLVAALAASIMVPQNTARQRTPRPYHSSRQMGFNERPVNGDGDVPKHLLHLGDVGLVIERAGPCARPILAVD